MRLMHGFACPGMQTLDDRYYLALLTRAWKPTGSRQARRTFRSCVAGPHREGWPILSLGRLGWVGWKLSSPCSGSLPLFSLDARLLVPFVLNIMGYGLFDRCLFHIED